MIKCRSYDQTLCYWPAKPIVIVEIIGGSYLSLKPEISYKLLINGLIKKNFALHVWSYAPSFDHQIQANHAWKSLRKCRIRLEKRLGYLPPSFRLGHSLGSKLHLISPDGGRNSKGLISISFNNFTAKQSVPLFGKITSKLNLKKEFKPGAKETMKLIKEEYIQPKNLLISFNNDKLDQNSLLIKALKSRSHDKSDAIFLKGNHLTPASTGLKSKFSSFTSELTEKAERIEELVEIISNWVL